MVDFIKYTPIKIENTPTRIPISFENPLDIQLPQPSQESAVVQEEMPSVQSRGFRWTSGGAKEQPYIQETTSQVVQQPQQQNNNSENSTKSRTLQWALGKIGRPYVWGATGQNDSYDCSGLIYAAYKSNGVNVPRTTLSWLNSGKQTVGSTEGQPGDVIITGRPENNKGHARLITKNLGNGQYEVVEAKGRKYGVVTSTYTVGKDLRNIYRAQKGLKLIKK